MKGTKVISATSLKEGNRARERYKCKELVEDHKLLREILLLAYIKSEVTKNNVQCISLERDAIAFETHKRYKDQTSQTLKLISQKLNFDIRVLLRRFIQVGCVRDISLVECKKKYSKEYLKHAE